MSSNISLNLSNKLAILLTDCVQAPIQTYLVNTVLEAPGIEVSGSADGDIMCPIVQVIMLHRPCAPLEGMIDPMTCSP